MFLREVVLCILVLCWVCFYKLNLLEQIHWLEVYQHVIRNIYLWATCLFPWVYMLKSTSSLKPKPSKCPIEVFLDFRNLPLYLKRSSPFVLLQLERWERTACREREREGRKTWLNSSDIRLYKLLLDASHVSLSVECEMSVSLSCKWSGPSLFVLSTQTCQRKCEWRRWSSVWRPARSLPPTMKWVGTL